MLCFYESGWTGWSLAWVCWRKWKNVLAFFWLENWKQRWSTSDLISNFAVIILTVFFQLMKQRKFEFLDLWNSIQRFLVEDYTEISYACCEGGIFTSKTDAIARQRNSSHLCTTPKSSCAYVDVTCAWYHQFYTLMIKTLLCRIIEALFVITTLLLVLCLVKDKGSLFHLNLNCFEYFGTLPTIIKRYINVALKYFLKLCSTGIISDVPCIYFVMMCVVWALAKESAIKKKPLAPPSLWLRYVDIVWTVSYVSFKIRAAMVYRI